MKRVALPLGLTVLAAGVLGTSLPAQASFSFTPASGTLDYVTALDQLDAKLFNSGNTEELILQLSAPTGITGSESTSYLNQFNAGDFYLYSLPSNSVLDYGTLTPGSTITFSGNSTGGTNYTNLFLNGTGFTDKNGQPVTFGNSFTLDTSSSIFNSSKGNVSGGSGSFAPVPEASSVASLGGLLLLGGLVAMRRRRIA